MGKRALLCLVMLVAVTIGVFSQTSTNIHFHGNMSRAAFNAEYFFVREAAARTNVRDSIRVELVPLSVNLSVWQELRRFNLRTNDVFTVMVEHQTITYLFFIQITDNGRSWGGWVWHGRGIR